MDISHKTKPRSTVGKLAIGLLVALCVAIGVVVLSPADRIGRHPEFGSIYETRGADLNEARDNPTGKFLRRVLPQKVIGSRYFPDRYRESPRFLVVGGHALEWSLGGWLYFHDPAAFNTVGAWEFAPCSGTNLAEVSRAMVPSQFFGANDPGIPQVFDTGSTSNAIHLVVNRTVFARRTDNPEVCFVLCVTGQTGNFVTVRYCRYSEAK